jgi:hypothetical protein
MPIREMHEHLQSCRRYAVSPQRGHWWKSWYEGAHVSVLHRNSQRMESLGLSLRGCLSTLAGDEPQPWTVEVEDKQKRELQRFLTRSLKNIFKPNARERTRHKLNLRNWLDHAATRPSDTVSATKVIPGPHEWTTRRVLKNLQRLPGLVPPRVCAAVWRFLWNGWCTACRFQQEGRPNDKCWLGCGETAHDKIEHYCRCSVVKQVFWTKMHVDLHPDAGLPCFCLATRKQSDDDALAITALGVYAVYMSTNFYRATYGPTSVLLPDRTKQHLAQSIINGCQGHPALTKLLDGRWGKPPIHILHA